jgi:hypothetical protein
MSVGSMVIFYSGVACMLAAIFLYYWIAAELNAG